MSSHQDSTPTSRRFCDFLIRGVEEHLGKTGRRHAKDVCSLGGRPKFAYVYHRRAYIDVYLRCREADGQRLSALLGKSKTLSLLKRDKFESNWARATPYHLKVKNEVDSASAVPLLLYVAKITKLSLPARPPRIYLSPSEDDAIATLEGGSTTVSVNIFERDRKARQRCLELFGRLCSVCGLDFGKRYGEIGEGFIHVHHLTPLSMITERYKVDPAKHLRPVCPNCHEMLHKHQPPFSIEELRAKLIN